MEYDDIRKQRTKLTAQEMREALNCGCSGLHESTMRAWTILEKVKALLSAGTEPAIVSELIAMMETKFPPPSAVEANPQN